MSRLFLHIEKWRADYGRAFAFTQGNMVVLCLCDFGVAREFCQCKSAEFGRSACLRKNMGILMGYDSIVSSKRKSWALQRKIIAPEFFNDKIKGMVDMMVESVIPVLEKWESQMEEAGGVASVRIDEDLKSLSAEMISKACLGSNYIIGSEIFYKMLVIQDLQSKQQAIVVHNFGCGLSVIVDNCKATLLAGNETTWQEHIRAEVVEILGNQAPNMDKLHKMKLLNMMIYETLRLYSPGPFVMRETSEEMKFGDFVSPKGVNVWLSSLLHQDQANWGDNAQSSIQKGLQMAFLRCARIRICSCLLGPGIHTCVGQNFAMTELKMVLSLVLSKFIFSLSPEHKHLVTYKLFYEPVHGVQLKMEKI
ncbi:hypothetical protein ACJRO7_006791 [Eucalyptus globulus]|uniref:Cytochrome P450 n=1 Tax=Eucalyptus globulus TaxID=34317 RepID=A0ABD3IJ13_EUCGL